MASLLLVFLIVSHLLDAMDSARPNPGWHRTASVELSGAGPAEPSAFRAAGFGKGAAENSVPVPDPTGPIEPGPAKPPEYLRIAGGPESSHGSHHRSTWGKVILGGFAATICVVVAAYIRVTRQRGSGDKS